MELEAKLLQERFIKNIKTALSPNINLIDELADLLNISTDSVYRRIRCETLFNIEEVALICKHFHISFDPTVQHLTNKVTFDYLMLDDKRDNFALWLNAMCSDVKRIGSNQQNQIIYAADDVPIWHHFYNSHLAAFKLFYWLKCILCEPNFVDAIFDVRLIDSKLIEACRQMHNDYNQIPSVEIWTEDTINSTLKQIEFFWESGFFNSKDEALLICDLFEEELNLLQKKAANSSKNLSGKENFSFYKSEIMIGNNSILVNIGNTRIAYLSNNTFNMMSTTNPDFVAENDHWLQNLIKKSVLLSGVSEKQRNQFFSKLKLKVAGLKAQINDGK